VCGGLRPQATGGAVPHATKPLGLNRAEGLFQILDACTAVLSPAVLLLCLVSLVVFRRSAGVQRQQLK
jgi:hypothetical protein